MLVASLFTAFFGAVYEHFSHGVYSYYMIYAFAIPLAGGLLPLLLLLSAYARSAVRKDVRLPGRLANGAWNAGLATLTVGCVMKGVLDIYGTSNGLLAVYPVAGAILLATGLFAYCFRRAA